MLKNLLKDRKYSGYKKGDRVVVVRTTGLFPSSIKAGDAGVITRRTKIVGRIPVLVVDFDNGEKNMGVPGEYANNFIRKE